MLSDQPPAGDATDEAVLDGLVRQALARMRQRLPQAMPRSATHVSEWMEGLAPAGNIAAYFLHPRAFPALRLPWWLDQTVMPVAGPGFQRDLVYSTIHGYFAIRLLDDIMDGDPRACPQLLPACAFFHAEFQSVYQLRFEAGHPFWLDFARYWYEAADAAISDGALQEIDHAAFCDIAARKVCAGLIPLAALAYYKRIAFPPEWQQLFQQLAEWHQLRNDFFDWSRDLLRGGTTYILCEARRRSACGETVAVWMVREGVSWCIETLRDRLRHAQALARAIDARGAVQYIDGQVAELDDLARSLDSVKGRHGFHADDG